jgi:hypothetical protein
MVSALLCFSDITIIVIIMNLSYDRSITILKARYPRKAI